MMEQVIDIISRRKKGKRLKSQPQVKPGAPLDRLTILATGLAHSSHTS
jgi:hypothetical protein